MSSSIIDRVAGKIGRKLVEVPVEFKWFVPGLLDGSLAFGGEESAGASFLRRDGTEDVYKLYAESFRGREHLQRIQKEAQALISGALAGATE